MFFQSIGDIKHKCVVFCNKNNSNVLLQNHTIVCMNTLASRLKEARKEKKLSQEALAKMLGADHGSFISNVESGRNKSFSKIVQAAEILGVNALWLAEGKGPKHPVHFHSMTAGGNKEDDFFSPEMEYVVRENPPPTYNQPHERDYALIPQYHVSGECGSGYLNGHEEIKGGLAFKRDWLLRMSLKPDSLSVIYASGLSMSPTINEGEVLLVDHDQNEPKDGQVFAIERDGELLIKRLVRHPAGGWICRSDNPDKIRYADWEPVSAEQLGMMRVVGRIVWRGGAM